MRGMRIKRDAARRHLYQRMNGCRCNYNRRISSRSDPNHTYTQQASCRMFRSAPVLALLIVLSRVPPSFKTSDDEKSATTHSLTQNNSNRNIREKWKERNKERIALLIKNSEKLLSLFSLSAQFRTHTVYISCLSRLKHLLPHDQIAYPFRGKCNVLSLQNSFLYTFAPPVQDRRRTFRRRENQKKRAKSLLTDADDRLLRDASS